MELNNFNEFIENVKGPFNWDKKEAKIILDEFIKQKDAIQTIINALKDKKEGQARFISAWALGEIGDTVAITGLTEVLKNRGEDTYIRRACAEAIGAIKNEEALKVLLEVLKNKLDDNSVRSRCADVISEIGNKEVVIALSEILKSTDDHEFVRRSCAENLGKIGNEEAFAVLSEVLRNKNETGWVRSGCAQGLGIIGKKALVVLAEVLKNKDDSDHAHNDCVEAIEKIGGKEAIAILLEVLKDSDYYGLVRSRSAEILGDIGDTESREVLIDILDNKNEDDSVRCGCAAGLGAIGDKEAFTVLVKILKNKDNNDYVRSCCARGLSRTSNKNEVYPIFIDVIITGSNEKLRKELVKQLEQISVDWRTKAKTFLKYLEKSTSERGVVSASDIIHAIQFEKPYENSAERLNAELNENKTLLTNYFIENAIGKDNRMTGILAKLIIQSAGESPLSAGELLDAYQKDRNISDDVLRKLRIEIGGEIALKSVLQTLQENLEKNFQTPISKLNDDTHSMWQNTISDARFGFKARINMSIVLFIVGILLLMTSAYQIIFGDLSSDKFFGPGVSFVSGLGMMLLIIYTGPLKEIRLSVSDLGIDNAAFMAYIHRVLQISHTFSYYYLNQKMSYDDMKTSNQLIQDAMVSTVDMLLRNKDAQGSESLYQKFSERVFDTIESATNKDSSAVDTDKSATNKDSSAVNADKSATNKDSGAGDTDKSATNKDSSAVDADKSTTNKNSTAGDTDKSATNKDSSA